MSLHSLKLVVYTELNKRKCELSVNRTHTTANEKQQLLIQSRCVLSHSRADCDIDMCGSGVEPTVTLTCVVAVWS